eukprot:3059883-Pleurochrysis_carterae.AAC.1
MVGEPVRTLRCVAPSALVALWPAACGVSAALGLARAVCFVESLEAGCFAMALGASAPTCVCGKR